MVYIYNIHVIDPAMSKTDPYFKLLFCCHCLVLKTIELTKLLNLSVAVIFTIVVITKDIKVGGDDVDYNSGTAKIKLYPIEPENNQVNVR